MKKLLLIGSAIIIIIIILLVVLVSNLGPIIKTAVNTYGPEITKTKISLGDVGISIFSGEARLKGFVLGNPKGFKTPNAVSVGSVYVDVDKGSLTKDTIIINKIEVKAPEITYEKTAGTDNFQALLNNVKSAESPAKPSEKQSEKGGNGKKIIIRNFILDNGKVNLATALLGGKSVSAALPDIHLKDLGKESGGTSPAEAFEKIFTALHKSITSRAVTDALNQNLKGLTKDIEGAAENVKQQGEEVKQQGENAKKELEKNVDAVKGGAKQLFGK